MKLADWARQNGVHPLTAGRWFRNGTLPVRAEKLPSGTILVYEDERVQPAGAFVVLYARVSTHEQRADADRQLERLRAYAAGRGYVVTKEVIEVGSGLNGVRRKLLALLSNPSVTTIIVEHRDRLARFGVEYIEALLHTAGRRLEVVNGAEHRTDLVQDFVDVVTSMCAKIYGNRGAKNRRDAILQHIKTPYVSSAPDSSPPDERAGGVLP